MKKAEEILSKMGKQAGSIPAHLKVVVLADANEACLTYAQQFIDQHNLIIAYANIAAGVGISFFELTTFHKWFKAQGYLTRQDVGQFLSRGIPLHSTAKDMFGLNINKDRLSFDQYLKCIEFLTQSGGQFFNLVQL